MNSNFVNFIGWYFFAKEFKFDVEELQRYRHFIKDSQETSTYPIILDERLKVETVKRLATLTGCPLLLLKSAALNQNIFDENKIRPGTDVDILIRVDDAKKIRPLLEENYIRITKSNKPFADSYESSWKCNKFHKIIDLHINITNPLHYQISPEDLFNYSEIHPFYNNENIRVPCIEHLIIHSILHMLKDADLENQTIFDYYYLKFNAKYSELKLKNTIEDWGLKKAITFGLSSIKSMFEEEKEFDMVRDKLYFNGTKFGKVMILFRTMDKLKFFTMCVKYFLIYLNLLKK